MNKIYGNTVGITTPRSDWNQTDDSKADYIKNKPELGELASKDVVERTDLAEDVQESLDKVVEVDLGGYSTTAEMNSAINTKAEEILTSVENTYARQTDVYSTTEIDAAMSNKSDSTHNHDDDYDVKGAASEALANAQSYTDTKTSDLASTSSVNASISEHNTSTSAHNDIRGLITDLTTKLNQFLDVDDTTTDQLSEVLTLIENNKGTLESLTSSKVNVSDIIDNLTTSDASKVLSANQGVAIKALIDALQTAVNGKADASHGTHVSYSTTAPVMDGTASVGSASTVARSDHKHPTDTTRAAASELSTHTGNTTVHITSTERTNWNNANTNASNALSEIAAIKNGSATIPSVSSAVSAEKDGKNQNIASTYIKGLSVSGQTVTYTRGDGTTGTITTQDTNTTYTHPSTHPASMITGLATVATSGSYNDLNNQPTIPTKTSQLTNDSGFKTTDNNTTYSLSKSGSTITLTGSDGSTTSVTDADTNTTYSLSSFGITASAAELNYTDGVTSNIQTQLNGKAASSHGNHVPATQTADNAKFLRNDNTWQTVTPANIGAAPTSHTHTKSQITDFPTSMPASDVYSWAKASSKPSYTFSEITSKPSYYDAKAIKGITRSGTTFTYTCMDGTTGTFTQQDNNTTYSLSSFGVTASATELNYTDGVTSNIQTQLDARKITWDCPTLVGSYSRLCHFDMNYASYLLIVRFYQTSQALCNTYLITQAHSMAKIIHLGGNGYKQNSDLSIRLIAGSDNISAYVELLNNYSYDGSTTITAHCSCIPLSDIGTCTRYTSYTATAGGTVLDSIDSMPSGIGGSTGKVVYQVTDPKSGLYCNGSLTADSVNSISISDQWHRYKRFKIYACFPKGLACIEFPLDMTLVGADANFGDRIGCVSIPSGDHTSGANNHYLYKLHFCVKETTTGWTFQVTDAGWLHMGIPAASTTQYATTAVTINGTAYWKWNQRHNSDYTVYKIVGYED